VFRSYLLLVAKLNRDDFVVSFNSEILFAIVCGIRANRKIKVKAITSSAYYEHSIGPVDSRKVEVIW